MNNTIRHALFALAAVGALSLSACKTSGDSTDQPTPAATPASDTMTPPPATPPAQDGSSTTP